MVWWTLLYSKQKSYEGSAREECYEEIRGMKRLGIKIFPTLILSNSLGNSVKLKGYHSFEVLENAKEDGTLVEKLADASPGKWQKTQDRYTKAKGAIINNDFNWEATKLEGVIVTDQSTLILSKLTDLFSNLKKEI